MITPGLYIGSVMHRRLASPPHRFAYKSFWVALDLDLLEANLGRLRLFSLEGLNLFSLKTRDYADGTPGRLRPKIEALCGGLDVSGSMVLFTTPRMFGFAFNPLSVYFCQNSSGVPSAIAWEVTNTFGGRHTYVIPVEQAGGVIRQRCEKHLHVSPFLGMELNYRFRVEASDLSLRIGIVDQAADRVLMAAALAATRRELTDRALAKLLAGAPLATLKVLAAIYWEALRLWAKGARFHKTPSGGECPIPSHSASVVKGRNA